MDHVRRTAQHAAKLAKHHAEISKACAKCFKVKKAKMGELDPEALNELLAAFEEHHMAIADELSAYAEHCEQCADEATEKAAQDRLKKRDGDGAAIQPGVRIPPPGFVAIPRGAQKLPAPAAAEVPAEFTKLFSASDEESLRQ